jgi:hypothetical protein
VSLRVEGCTKPALLSVATVGACQRIGRDGSSGSSNKRSVVIEDTGLPGAFPPVGQQRLASAMQLVGQQLMMIGTLPQSACSSHIIWRATRAAQQKVARAAAERPESCNKRLCPQSSACLLLCALLLLPQRRRLSSPLPGSCQWLGGARRLSWLAPPIPAAAAAPLLMRAAAASESSWLMHDKETRPKSHFK